SKLQLLAARVIYGGVMEYSPHVWRIAVEVGLQQLHKQRVCLDAYDETVSSEPSRHLARYHPNTTSELEGIQVASPVLLNRSAVSRFKPAPPQGSLRFVGD